MKTIKVKVFSYDELNEDAKEKARQWFSEGFDGRWEWQGIIEDAKQIGLSILELEQHRPNRGDFWTTADDTAQKIITNHGSTCETYKSAKRYLLAVRELGNEPDEEENYNAASEWQRAKAELEGEL